MEKIEISQLQITEDMLISAIESVNRERDEAASAADMNVPILESIVARKGMVCPERHPVSVRVVMFVSSDPADRCHRCSAVPRFGEVRGCCVPCGLLFCWRCVETWTC